MFFNCHTGARPKGRLSGNGCEAIGNSQPIRLLGKHVFGMKASQMPPAFSVNPKMKINVKENGAWLLTVG